MEINEYSTAGNTSFGRPVSRASLHPLHEAAMRLAGMGKPKTNSKARDLVTMLLAHGARAWRNSQAPVSIHLYLTSPSGRNPIRMHVDKKA